MPSSIGHLLGGISAAWVADLVPGDRGWRFAPSTASWYARAGNGLTLACAVLAAAPDVDVLWRVHRTATHSVVAVIAIGLASAVVAMSARRPVLRVSVMCAAAVATHIALDWLGVDNNAPRGIQLLWPLSDRWFISGVDLFPATAREHPWTAASMRVNVVAVAVELAILSPLATACWALRARLLTGRDER